MHKASFHIVPVTIKIATFCAPLLVGGSYWLLWLMIWESDLCMMSLCRELQREVKESKEKKRKKKRRRSDSSEGEGGGSGTSEDEGDLEENCEQLSEMFHGYCVSMTTRILTEYS